MSDGSGGAPQLDEVERELRWFVRYCETVRDVSVGDGRETWDYRARWAERLAGGVAAASPGAGELDLTDDECAALLKEFEPGGGAAPGHVLDTIEAKLRARLDRKDDEA